MPSFRATASAVAAAISAQQQIQQPQVSNEIQSIDDLSELNEVVVAKSDKFYVPRAKDRLKKEAQIAAREEAEAQALEREREREEVDGLAIANTSKRKPMDLTPKSEPLDFSDDEEEEDAVPKPRSTNTSMSAAVKAEMNSAASKSSLSKLASNAIHVNPSSAASNQAVTTVSHKEDSENAGAHKAEAKTEEMSDEEEDEEKSSAPSNPASSKATENDDDDDEEGKRPAAVSGRTNVAPLINPDAYKFALEQAAVTALGGLAITHDQPLIAQLVSLAAFSLPAVLLTVFCALIYEGTMTQPLGCLVAGLVAFALHMALHLSSLLSSKSSQRVEPSSISDTAGKNIMRASLLKSLFPLPSMAHSFLAALLCLTHGALYALLVGLSVFTFDFAALESYLAVWPLYIVCAMPALLVTLNSLMGRAYNEPNQWFGDEQTINAFTRPLFLLTLSVLALTTRLTPNPDDALLYAYLVALSLWPFTPIFSLLGLLPQLRALTAWAVEQLNIVVFHASPSYNELDAVLMLIVSIGCSLVSAGIYSSLNATPSLFFAIAAGFVLSQSLRVKMFSFDAHFLIATGLSVLVAGLGFVLYGLNVQAVDALSSLYVDGSWHWISDAGVLSLTCLSLLQSALSAPYLMRFFRNPGLMDIERPPSLWQRLLLSKRTTLVQQIYVLLYFAMRFHLSESSPSFTAYQLFVCACSIGMFQGLWINVHDALEASLLVCLIDRFALDGWIVLEFPVRLLIAALLLNRCRDLAGKAEFMLALTWSSNTVPKLQTRHPRTFRVLAVLLFPFHCTMLALSVALSLPLYPLLGASIFLPSFPRPQRVFQRIERSLVTTANAQVHHYYRTILDPLLAKLPMLLLPLRLSSHRQHAFLLRCEPYTLIIQVHANTSEHLIVSIKGMELEMTSCHTSETSTLDDHIHLHAQRPLFNPSPLHCYQPISNLSLPCFVPSTVSMVGVLDDRAVLELIRKSFYRILVISMAKSCVGNIKALKEAWKVELAERDLVQAKAEFPEALYNQLFVDPKAASAASAADHQRGKTALQSLYALVYTLPPSALQPRSTQQLFNLYSGKLPTSLRMDLLKRADRTDLTQMLIDSFQYAIKFSMDAHLQLNASIIENDDAESLKSFIEEFNQMHNQLRIGVADDQVLQHIQAGCTELFALKLKQNSSHSLQAVTLSQSTLNFSVLQLNFATLESIWTGMAVELLYFGNDDDERYSIQANEWLLRNMTVQAAEAPLGYAAYYSGLHAI